VFQFSVVVVAYRPSFAGLVARSLFIENNKHNGPRSIRGFLFAKTEARAIRNKPLMKPEMVFAPNIRYTQEFHLMNNKKNNK
jgi:hypothetical protein